MSKLKVIGDDDDGYIVLDKITFWRVTEVGCMIFLVGESEEPIGIEGEAGVIADTILKEHFGVT